MEYIARADGNYKLIYKGKAYEQDDIDMKIVAQERLDRAADVGTIAHFTTKEVKTKVPGEFTVVVDGELEKLLET